MARPRKSPHLKNQPITISLPPAMIASIDEELSYNANRSKWIQDAIALKQSGAISFSNNQLGAKLLNLLRTQPETFSITVLESIQDALPLAITEKTESE